MTWQKISSKQVYKNKWMEVTEDIVKNDSGKELNFGVVHKKPFALIIPWDGKFLTLVGQYRYPVDFFSWEFPMGHFEDHSSIEEAAKQELQEEAGLKAGKMQEIKDFYLGPGHHTQVCYMFLAIELEEVGQSLEDSEEGMQVKKVTVDEFREMVKEGIIKDGPTLSAFGILMALDLLK